MPEYLVQYGRSAFVGKFTTGDESPWVRGSQVVVQSPRGLELGTLLGPVLGAALLTLIEESSRVLLGGSGRGIDLIVYSLLIIAIAVYYPRGVVGWLSDFVARRRNKGGKPS